MFAELAVEGHVRVTTRGPVVILASWITVVAPVRPASFDNAHLFPAPEPLHVINVRKVLPQPPQWSDQALCGQMGDPEDVVAQDALFFGVDDEGRPALPPKMVEAAREYCNACQVRGKCLTWALVNDERFGIWGGTTGRERTRYRAEIRAGETTIEEIVAARTGP